jgi:hypothetical protein
VTLSSRLARLEAVAPPPVGLDGPMGDDERDWNEQFAEALQTLLRTIPERYAGRVVAAVQSGGWWPDPVARRAVEMTLQAIPTPDVTWFPMAWRGWIGCHGEPQGPFALPVETCELLDRHPDSLFERHDCERCGYVVPERPHREWFAKYVAGGRVGKPRRTFMERCPLCVGAVGWLNYMASRSRCIQARQQLDWARERGITCPHGRRCPALAAAGE